jgi:hypothetical protein
VIAGADAEIRDPRGITPRISAFRPQTGYSADWIHRPKVAKVTLPDSTAEAVLP